MDEADIIRRSNREAALMEIREERRGDALIVTPLGRVDTNTCDEFQSFVFERLDAGSKRLVIDMSSVDYISSAGLRVFLMAAKRLQENGGRLALSGLTRGVKQVFELAGLMTIFVVEPDVERAVSRVTEER
jgi:anti-anti-sigma factor